MVAEPTRARRMLFPAWVAGLSILVLMGAVAGAIVFSRGLVVTNLTDLVPWGLWITIDLSAIALSAGAFLISAAVYLLGLKQFQPVARTAVFVGMIGYSMAMLMLLLDIGRPDRFWHAFAFWNIHSPLWEVTMCVGLYFTVLTLEVIPIFGQADWMKSRWPRLASRLSSVHHLAPFLAVIGLGLSLLHQSSLGATYGVLKSRPIWYRPDMAVLFIASAIVAGPALTVLASKLAGRLSTRAKVNDALLENISRFIGGALAIYLYLRFWDAFAMSYTYQPAQTEGLHLLTRGPLAFNFWVGEILLGIVVPMIILLNGRLRRIPLLHILALFLVVGGLVAYRWDINLVGQLVVYGTVPHVTVPRYTHYVPSLIEIMAGIGVVAYGLLAFTLGVRYLNIIDHSAVPGHAPVDEISGVPAVGATD
jgi:Ni/Fe-hydrogenase subunit HybB-like protein